MLHWVEHRRTSRRVPPARTRQQSAEAVSIVGPASSPIQNDNTKLQIRIIGLATRAIKANVIWQRIVYCSLEFRGCFAHFPLFPSRFLSTFQLRPCSRVTIAARELWVRLSAVTLHPLSPRKTRSFRNCSGASGTKRHRLAFGWSYRYFVPCSLSLYPDSKPNQIRFCSLYLRIDIEVGEKLNRD